VGAISAAEKLGYSLRVSAGGVRAGHRPDGQAGHSGGHAVDLDGINGSPVGFNQVTWKFIADMIDSGTVIAIGTIAEIANSQEMRAHAAHAGVRLFADPGTGAHVHLQVR